MYSVKHCLIILYIGKLPSFFEYWKKTAQHNTLCDFYIFSDQIQNEKREGNINLMPITLEEVQQRTEKTLGQRFEEISKDNIVKLCDLKAAYGEIFEEISSQYEWFGWADLDFLLGNFQEFFTNELLETHDMVGYKNKTLFGPFTMLKTKYKDLYRQVPDYKNLITKNSNKYPKKEKRHGCNDFDETHFSKVCLDLNIFQHIGGDKNGVSLIRLGFPRFPIIWEGGTIRICLENYERWFVKKNGNTSMGVHLGSKEVIFTEFSNGFVCTKREL